jgi:hypothetical protein
MRYRVIAALSAIAGLGALGHAADLEPRPKKPPPSSSASLAQSWLASIPPEFLSMAETVLAC